MSRSKSRSRRRIPAPRSPLQKTRRSHAAPWQTLQWHPALHWPRWRPEWKHAGEIAGVGAGVGAEVGAGKVGHLLSDKFPSRAGSLLQLLHPVGDLGGDQSGHLGEGGIVLGHC